MTAVARIVPANRNSLLRSIALGGLFIFISQLVIQSWLVASVIQQNPFISVLQYMASGATGVSAFEGGTGTALLGVFFHLIVSFVVAAVFVLSANQVPFLRRNVIAGSLLYGIGVYIVMSFIVLPLSAAPPLPAPTVPYIIEAILEHALVVGLPLGLLVQRSASPNP